MNKLLLFCVAFLCFDSLYAQESSIVEGDILVKFTQSTSVESFCKDFKVTTNSEVNFKADRCLSKSINLWLLKYDPKSGNAETILSQVRNHKDVLIAQHNHTNVTLRTTTPNDTQFGNQWGHNNTGQSGGTIGADIESTEAWDISTGGMTTQGDEIVVAVIDGGFELTHPDLVPNLWVNTDEIPGNGLDDDNNGFVDDINGWDAFNNDGTIPNSNHGTHVSGIVGARGNNNQGVSGVNWDVKLMMVAGSSGNEATVVAAYGYVLDERTLYNTTNGAQGAFVVSTNSSFGVDFGNAANFPLWCAMYDDMGAQGIISATATANQNIDVDAVGDVPTTCISDYMIGVTNTTDTDARNNGAAFGATSIDIGAPGTGILSTTLNGNYGNLTGTSMATPQVAGAVALLMAAACDDFITDYKNNPGVEALALRDAILDGADPITALNGITTTGGRLNVYNSILELNPGANGQCNPDFSLSTNQDTIEVCSPSDAVYSIDVISQLNFIDPVTLSVTGQPSGTTVSFSSNPVVPGNNTIMTISNTSAAASGTYNLVVTGTSTTTPKVLDLELNIQNSVPGTVGLLTPANGTTNVSLSTLLTWTPVANATSYSIDVATDNAFTNIVDTGMSADVEYAPAGLATNTMYFWRVTPQNICGSGTVSTPSSFVTQNATYCTSQGNSTRDEWIGSIEVANVTSTTGDNNGYADFTSTVIDVELGLSYNLMLSPEWSGRLFNEYWMVWIDYNADGDFTDAGENIYDSGTANQNIQNGSFSIPTTATVGQTRMRISMKFNSQPTSCETFNFGEVEDYTINITDPATLWYLDFDNDNFGDINQSMSAVTQPPGYVSDNTDCDDTDNTVFPGATELCDGKDNNCDGNIDEGALSTYYADVDGDGFGDASNSIQECSVPAGFVENSNDCNDNNANVFPGAMEICGDGLDNNCNGTTDEACPAGPCGDTFLVINAITQNNYHAEIAIESDAIVNSSNSILFTAGTEIELLQGFEVIIGTEFEARIAPCTLLHFPSQGSSK